LFSYYLRTESSAADQRPSDCNRKSRKHVISADDGLVNHQEALHSTDCPLTGMSDTIAKWMLVNQDASITINKTCRLCE